MRMVAAASVGSTWRATACAWLGADGAEAAGRLAALACLADLGMPRSQPEVAELRAKLRTMERFRQGLLQAFPWPHEAAAELPDSTVVCRCEVDHRG